VRALLSNRNFLLLLVGQTVSSLGTWVNFVGLNLYVYDLFGSGTVLGAFLTARMLPAIFFGPIGGMLSDRYPPRLVMIVCDALRTILVLGFVTTRSLWQFFILGVALSAIDKIFLAASGAFVPSIVPREGLLEANAASRMSHSIVSMIGPAVGGLLVSACSYRWVFILDALTFVVSVGSLCLMIVPDEATTPRSVMAPWEGIVVVASFFRCRRALAYLVVVRMIDALGSGAYNTAMPVFSRSLVPGVSAVYGWLVGAWALGEFVGAWATRRVSRLCPGESTLFAVAVTLMACAMAGMFHCQTASTALVLVFLSGIGDGLSNVLFNTTLMNESPAELRGRVFGSTIAMLYTTVAIGMALSGAFLDRISLRLTTDIASAFIVIGVAVGYALMSKRPRTEGGSCG